MAERGRSNFRFCSRFLRDNKRHCNNNKQKKKKKRFLNQKLEQEKHNSSGNKGLSLDPHRNLHHHHLFQNRNHGDAEEEEEEEGKQDKYNFSLTNHQELPAASFQELFHQNQLLLYGRRLDPADHHQPPPEPTPPLKKRSHFPSSSSSLGLTTEHASLRGKMPESYQNPSPRLGGLINNAAVVGEIVEVQGGHIVRSIGRKDRHSKVCTAKGPRDRRVRLAAHTAIQFYDVQDRLGYDRPSKAVDWLIKKAKAAIDELAELPAWHPTAAPSAPDAAFEQENAEKNLEAENQQHNIHHQADLIISNVSGSSNKSAMAMFGGENEQISSFLPPSLDSDVIADTIKSFFPTGCAAGETSSSSMQFRNFSTNDLLSRNSNNNTSQDLRLSLQSLQDPDFVHHHHNPPPNTNPRHRSEQQARAQGQNVVLNDSPLGFNGWLPLEHHQPAYEHNRLQRLAPWNPGGDTTTASTPENAGFLFNSPPPAAQQIFGGHHNQFSTSSQRGPLQSSNTPSVRAWMEPSAAITLSMADQHHHPGALPVYPSLFSGGIGFASGYGGFSGFHIPARIQSDEEEHDGYSDKPSSASSDSRH